MLKQNKIEVYITILLYVVILLCTIMLARNLFTLVEIRSQIADSVEFRAMVDNKYTELLSKSVSTDQSINSDNVDTPIDLPSETTVAADIMETELGDGYVFETNADGYTLPHKSNRVVGELNEYGIPYIVDSSSYGMMYYQEFGPMEGYWITGNGQFLWGKEDWNGEDDFEPGSVG